MAVLHGERYDVKLNLTLRQVPGWLTLGTTEPSLAWPIPHV